MCVEDVYEWRRSVAGGCMGSQAEEGGYASLALMSSHGGRGRMVGTRVRTKLWTFLVTYSIPSFGSWYIRREGEPLECVIYVLKARSV